MCCIHFESLYFQHQRILETYFETKKLSRDFTLELEGNRNENQSSKMPKTF